MTSKHLRACCINLYGSAKGNDLYKLMREVAQKDFCVATGWSASEISIARSCAYAGKIFRVSEDYQNLIAPDGKKLSVRTAKFADIAAYLPGPPKKVVHPRNNHCGVDSIVNSAV